MNNIFKLVLAAIFLSSVPLALHAANQEKLSLSPQESEFSRFLKVTSDEDGGAVWTARKQYKSSQFEPVIEFFGMAHAGTPRYYKRLITAINDADVVLYEFRGDLVSTLAAINTHNVCLQVEQLRHAQAIAEGLVSQMIALKDIDFSSSRFVHADIWDLSAPPTLRLDRCIVNLGKMLRREGANSYLSCVKTKDINSCIKIPDPQSADDVIKAYKKKPPSFRKEFAEIWKEMISLNQAEVESTKESFEDKERNNIIFEKLADILAHRKEGKILIMYGAGHGPDIEKNIRARFGYTLESEQWERVLRF